MSENDVIDVEPIGHRASDSAASDSLKTWGWVSYILHLIVAVAAVVPGAQVPPQAPLLQTNGQFWLSIHVPSREQALRVLPSHLVSP